MSVRLLARAVAVATTTAALGATTITAVSAAPTAPLVGETAVASQLLVGLKTDALPGRHGARRLDQLAVADRTIARLSFDSPSAAAAAATALRTDPAVAYVTTNRRLVLSGRTAPRPDHYGAGHQWGLYGGTTAPAHESGVNAPAAWDRGLAGAGTVVAVLDEGVQVDHPDLVGRVFSNKRERVNGKDDDNNGFVDDVHGWDFANDDASVYDGGSLGTEDIHGTHVAGLIVAAQERTQSGVTGVAPGALVLPVKVFDSLTGGTLADILEGFSYVRRQKAAGVNIVAINASWGMAGDDPALRSAVEGLAADGIALVASAGNSALDLAVRPQYPASYDLPHVISVGAMDPSGVLAGFSNRSADIAAPGVSMLSTAPGGSYLQMSGTSMAAPMVAGAVALYAGSHAGVRAEGVVAAVLAAARVTGALDTSVVGARSLDVSAL